jgi:inner membrane protein
MTSRTHDIIAFSALITAAAYFPPHELNVLTMFAALVGSVVGSLVPDLDQGTNRLWELLPVGKFTGHFLRRLLLEHRTISHSFLGGFIFYNILVFVIPRLFNPIYVNTGVLVTAIMIGYISHLIADMFTKDGIPLFFPLPYKIGIPPAKSMRITTGGFVEKFIIFPGVLVYIFWIVTQKRELFLYLLRLIRS